MKHNVLIMQLFINLMASSNLSSVQYSELLDQH